MNEKINGIVEAKINFDNAYMQFIEGAITALELQTWTLTLLIELNNFQVNEMLNAGLNGEEK